jgi:hypothetical protein
MSLCQEEEDDEEKEEEHACHMSHQKKNPQKTTHTTLHTHGRVARVPRRAVCFAIYNEPPVAAWLSICIAFHCKMSNTSGHLGIWFFVCAKCQTEVG